MTIKKNRFKQLLYVQYTPDKFERRWEDFKSQAGVSRQEVWVKWMHERRFSETYFKGKISLGVGSTQHNESTNAFLGAS